MALACAYLPHAGFTNSVISAALWLPGLQVGGAPRNVAARPSSWPFVLAALNRGQATVGTAVQVLRSAGLTTEAACLGQPGLLSQAESLIANGHVLTVGCLPYPQQWVHRLGSGAPPALWLKGAMPTGPFVGVVGCRSIPATVTRLAHGYAQAARSAGYFVVSGGAPGTDAAAKACLTILPCGHQAAGFSRHGTVLSMFAPNTGFTGPQAMMRNALIYSLGAGTVVVSSRLKVGGTWGGATDALRRRLGRIVVHANSTPSAQALVALGGVACAGPVGLVAALNAPGNQVVLPGL